MLVRPTAPLQNKKGKNLIREIVKTGRTDILSLIPQKVHPEVPVPELFVRLPKETISFHESSTEKTKKLKSLEYNYEKEQQFAIEI